MAAAKTKKSTSSKGGSKASSSKPRPASSSTTRSTGTSSAARRSTNTKTSSAQRKAFMRGARSRGGLGSWGLTGLLALLVTFAVVYFSGMLSPKTAAEISVDEAYALYPDDAFFLDVREVVEFETGNVPGTVNIPLGELADRVSELPTDQQIVVVCRSGNRSQEGRDILLQAGFDDVTSMAGGVSDWKDAGYPYDGEVLR